MNISLVMSSRANDYQPVGLSFAKEDMCSLVASVYDYKVLLVWDDVV